MADNVAITAGTGTDIAADNISSVFYQRVKVTLGADGAADMDLDSGQQTMANSLPVTLASDQSVLSMGGKTAVISGSVTRPADTTEYATGDVITDSTSSPAVITFTGCARANAGTGAILGAVIIDSANQSFKSSLELWLFDTTFTADNDNSVFTPTDAELLTLVGVIPFSTWYTGTITEGANGNAISQGVMPFPMAFKTGAASTSLFGTLVVRNTYAPISAEVFTIRLMIQQD